MTMPRSNDQSLGNAIREFLHSYNLEDKLNETKVIQSWGKIVGPMVEKHTHGLYIRNRILFVKVDSAALRQELSFSRSKIVIALNNEVKSNIIEDIVLK
jgi:predicted nucleic acid-binding Zn ribbon protein